MSAAIERYGGSCTTPIEAHRFNNIAVKCVFKCKGPGYKTYTNLHGHYMRVHHICLHRVATLNPNNEDEFRRQVTSALLQTPQGSHHDRVSPTESHPPLVDSPPQFTGPSPPWGYQMLGGVMFHPTPSNLGQGNLLGSPSWYSAPVPVESPYQNYNPDSRLPLLSEAGPSRFPAVRPATRHYPYPQSRPQRRESYMDPSPIRNRDILSTFVDYGLPTPSTSPPGAEWRTSSNTLYGYITPTTRPHNEVSVQSPFCPSTVSRHPGTPLPTARISTPAQLAQVPRYPTEAVVPDNFHSFATAQEQMFYVNFTREYEGSIPAYDTRHIQPRYQQPQITLTGSRGSAICLPTPPVGTNPLPDGSPRPPQEGKHKRPPRRVGQKRRVRPLNTPVASGPPPSRRTTQQPASRPNAHLANGFTKPEVAQQARELRKQEPQMEANASRETSAHCASPFVEGQVRSVVHEQDHTMDVTTSLLGAQEKENLALLADRQSDLADSPTETTHSPIRPLSRHTQPQVEEPTSIVRSATSPASACLSHGEVKPHESPQINDAQSIGEPSLMWIGSLQPRKCAQGQRTSGYPLLGPAVEPRATSEDTESVMIMQEFYQESVLFQGRCSDECHPTKATSKEEGGLRNGDAQDPFSDISWEGWGLIETPYGVYLPETFDPSPFGIETLSDRW